MRLAIRHLTRFFYPEPVWDSHNVLRACPTTDTWQRLLDYRVEVRPGAKVHAYVDGWGTRVDAFGIREPHTELVVVAHSTVETGARPSPAPTEPRLAYENERFREDHWRYLQPTRHTSWGLDIAAAARSATEGATTTTDLVERIESAVRRTLAYRPGATAIGVDVNEVFRQGAGVCQDFVHLGLAMYRSLGMPARYVSGYFYAVDGATTEAPGDVEVTVQTHAWLEVAVPGFGWWGLDPTNGLPAGERHVKVGHGQDYDDVMPLRGVYCGKTDHTLHVEVGMSRGHLSEMVLLQHDQ